MRGRPPGRRNLKSRVLERWRDDATDKRPCADTASLLPRTRWYDTLKLFPAFEVGPESEVMITSIDFSDTKQQRSACLPEPNLGRVNPVPS